MNMQNRLTMVVAVMLAGMLPIAGCEKKAETAPEPAVAQPEAQTTVGTEIDDSVITTRVKSALLADDIVKGLDIKVETSKGEVQLSGFVESQDQIDRAIMITKGVEGVKDVDNKMELKAMETSVGEKIDDGIVTTKVKAALLAEEGVNSTDIAVETREGVVQLSGFVDDAAQIEKAGEVTRTVEGVKDVKNDLAVRN